MPVLTKVARSACAANVVDVRACRAAPASRHGCHAYGGTARRRRPGTAGHRAGVLCTTLRRRCRERCVFERPRSHRRCTRATSRCVRWCALCTSVVPGCEVGCNMDTVQCACCMCRMCITCPLPCPPSLRSLHDPLALCVMPWNLDTIALVGRRWCDIQGMRVLCFANL